jgi:hypothetical protein
MLQETENEPERLGTPAFRMAAAAAVAAGLAAIIAVAATAWLWPSGGPHARALPARPPWAPAAAAPAVPAAAVPVPLTAAPAGVTWSLWDGVALPSSQDGPATRTPAAAGFTDTPAGCLLAAVNYLLRIPVGTAVEQSAQITQATTGLDRLMLLREVPIPREPDTAQVVAFRMPTWSAAACLADVARQVTVSSTVAYQSYEVPMVWQSGDWRMAGALSGSAAVQWVSDLTGFVAFSGVN